MGIMSKRSFVARLSAVVTAVIASVAMLGVTPANAALSFEVAGTTVPDAPVILPATAGTASAVAAWTSPVNDGGSPVISYHVVMVDGANGTNTIAMKDVAAPATSLSFTELPGGVPVSFRVQAVNAAGVGQSSALSNVVIPVSEPGAPQIGTTTTGIGSATGWWTAPASSGLAITKYHVVMVDAATGTKALAMRDIAGNLISVTVTGLAKGTPVRFKVQAVNALGVGVFSALSNAVTVLGPKTRTGVNRNPPGVGGYWTASLRGHNQVIVADGTNNGPNGRILMTTWTWTSAGWAKGGSYWAWGGSRGWGKTVQGDRKSPTGVFSLKDAGGYYANPGSRLRYFRNPAGFSKVMNGRRVFSYVMAIGYNHVTGTSPLSKATPSSRSKGNQIWIHEGHGSASLGCLGVARPAIVAMLKWANPAASPVILMGPHSQVVRSR